MRTLRRLAIPVLTLALTAGLVFWAFPDGLSPARTLGVVLGWAGCGLMLASLLLMLREPRLTAWLGGLEWMYQWHHWCGMAAYVLLLAHPLALAGDNLATAPALAWATISPFNEGWPVWSGWLALMALMLGLAATFARRLSYRARRGLHAALGVGVLLGLMHLVLLGIDEPVAPILAVAAALLAWRGIRHDWGVGARPYVVGSVQAMGTDIVEIALTPLADPIDVTPGQFVLVAFSGGPGFRGCGEFHPFTVSAIDGSQVIRVAVKALGDCTRHIQSVRPGVAARVQGAYGSFLAGPLSAPQFWVAGGIGITPFLALLRAGPRMVPTTLCYLYRPEADAPFVQELTELAQADPKLSLHVIATGNQPPELTSWLPAAERLAGRECYLCGPPAMIANLRRVLRRGGVAPREIHFESFELL